MDSGTAIMVITGVAAVVFGALQGYCGNLLTATMWAGRAIAPADFGPTPSNGLQDPITPPWLKKLQMVWMVGFVVVLIVGSLQLWYFGIVALGIAWAASTIARLILPQRGAYYLYIIVNSLAGRMADYQRDGDSMRAEVAHDLFLRVSRLFDEANRSNRALPSFREARSTPVGQIDLGDPQTPVQSNQRIPTTFLDDGVPDTLRSSAQIALAELRELAATEEEMRTILRVPEGATPLGLMEGMRNSDPEWIKRLAR